MPRTSYAELPEPTATAVALARQEHGPRLAVSAGRHLGCDVAFSHWQQASRVGGPETPVFIVPPEHVARAKRMGLTVA